MLRGMKASKAIKLCAWAAGVLLALALAAAGVTLRYADSLAKSGVESGASESLELETTTDSVHLSLLLQKFGINNLAIANMPGYSAPHLTQARDIDARIRLRSLMRRVLDVPLIEIDGVHVTIERRGNKNNVSEMLERLSKRATAPEAGAVRLQVKKVVIRNITADVQLLPVGGKTSNVNVVVPQVVIEDFSSEESRSIAIADLYRQLMPSIVGAVLQKGKGVLPKELTDELTHQLDQTVTALGDEVREILKKATGPLDPLIDKPLQGAEERLRGILGGKKKEGSDEKKEEPPAPSRPK